MSSKPFIIKAKWISPTVPQESEVYNEQDQTRIQILQAINGYLSINMLVQSFKIFWSFWHYTTQCPAFGNLSIGFFGINIIWGFCSYYGFKSVNSKKSQRITNYGYTVALNLILRIIMYIICGIVMKGYIPTYIQVTKAQKQKLICTALYPKGLYIITGVIQCLLCLFIIYLLRSVVDYVQRWQISETQKLIPKKQNKQIY